MLVLAVCASPVESAFFHLSLGAKHDSPEPGAKRCNFSAKLFPRPILKLLCCLPVIGCTSCQFNFPSTFNPRVVSRRHLLLSPSVTPGLMMILCGWSLVFLPVERTTVKCGSGGMRELPREEEPEAAGAGVEEGAERRFLGLGAEAEVEGTALGAEAEAGAEEVDATGCCCCFLCFFCLAIFFCC